MYSFIIQSSNPRSTGEFNPEDSTLQDAMETVFPMMAERAIISWNNTYIPVCYKYDLGVMIDDILYMLNCIRSADSGQVAIAWPSDTFRSDWEISWDENMISIFAKWETMLGHVESLLNESNSLTVSKMAYQSEWKKLLEVVINSLMQCGYSIEKLYDMKKLVVEYDAIAKFGLYYND